MKTTPILLFALALAACNAEAPPDLPSEAGAIPRDAAQPPPSDDPAPQAATGLARLDGYGAMRFGMTEAEARAAADVELDALGPGDDPGACHYLTPAGIDTPSDLAFMFEGDRFVRYDVGTDDTVAPGGGKRGMDADRIRALYPQVADSPHKYVEGGRYLRIGAADGEGVLVFETDAAGVVGDWRAGVAPQVDYVEGCS